MRELVARTGLLSPPYGDGTFEGSDGTKTVTFSPPYGDGTARQNILIGTETFSPPYGDGTAAPSRQGERPFGFRPFTGMVH